mmetsp:Transcript_82264/g.137525  ORF Transcript_82264/g.137525 Transcript_82264/m.137525 type:complete len:82 (+) Transcript_82264:33-278(+)
MWKMKHTAPASALMASHSLTWTRSPPPSRTQILSVTASYSISGTSTGSHSVTLSSISASSRLGQITIAKNQQHQMRPAAKC